MKKIMIQKITQNNWNSWTVNLIMQAKKLLTSRQIFRYAVPARTVTKKHCCNLRLNVIVMCRLSDRQFVWKYWIDYWFVCGGCRIQFDRLSIVKHCCISDCTLCYVLSLTSNFVRAHDAAAWYWLQVLVQWYWYWYWYLNDWVLATTLAVCLLHLLCNCLRSVYKTCHMSLFSALDHTIFVAFLNITGVYIMGLHNRLFSHIILPTVLRSGNCCWSIVCLCLSVFA